MNVCAGPSGGETSATTVYPPGISRRTIASLNDYTDDDVYKLMQTSSHALVHFMHMLLAANRHETRHERRDQRQLMLVTCTVVVDFECCFESKFNMVF